MQTAYTFSDHYLSSLFRELGLPSFSEILVFGNYIFSNLVKPYLALGFGFDVHLLRFEELTCESLSKSIGQIVSDQSVLARLLRESIATDGPPFFVFLHGCLAFNFFVFVFKVLPLELNLPLVFEFFVDGADSPFNYGERAAEEEQKQVHVQGCPSFWEYTVQGALPGVDPPEAEDVEQDGANIEEEHPESPFVRAQHYLQVSNKDHGGEHLRSV